MRNASTWPLDLENSRVPVCTIACVSRGLWRAGFLNPDKVSLLESKLFSVCVACNGRLGTEFDLFHIILFILAVVTWSA